MTRGLVIGKFYPPHKGHHFLIESARARVDELVVLVCDRNDQSIPAEVRAAWLREVHPKVTVMVIEDIQRDDDSVAWANHTVRFLGHAPDVVSSSEAYGERYSQLMGARHHMIDFERREISVSGRGIRSAPLQHWDYLEPCVHAWYARRVCIVGAESTGTTTLAQDLAAHFHTTWVPEVGRYYTEGKLHSPTSTDWRSEEFLYIAAAQNALEDAMARTCNKLLVCDTDSFATCIWHERYLGYLLPELEAFTNGRRYERYLLTDVDIPFVQDGTRDGEHTRHSMHQRFLDELRRRGKPFVVLSGTREARLQRAITICEEILAG